MEIPPLPILVPLMLKNVPRDFLDTSSLSPSFNIVIIFNTYIASNIINIRGQSEKFSA